MTKKTHIAVGVAATLPLISLLSPLVLLGIIGSFAPDWDILLRIKHRTITHSLLALSLSTLIISTFNYKIALVWGLNYLIHLILDSFTRTGVPWLYPFKKRYYGLKKVKTGESEDLFICLLAIGFIVFRFI